MTQEELMVISRTIGYLEGISDTVNPSQYADLLLDLLTKHQMTNLYKNEPKADIETVTIPNGPFTYTDCDACEVKL